MARLLLLYTFLILASCGVEESSRPTPEVHPSPLPPSSPQAELGETSIQKKAEDLEEKLIEVLQQQGTQHLARYLRLRADEGLDLRPVREFFFERNAGLPERIDIFIRPRAEPLIEFANEQLARSGVDFIEFNGIIDRSLPSIEEPLPSHEELYRKWQMARSTSMPLIGFAVTLIEARQGLAREHLVASLIRAFSILGLELQFTAFSAQWNRLWMQDQSLITWRMDVQNEKFRGVAEILNRFLDGASGIKRSHLYVYMVSWGYTLILYASGHLAYRIVAPGTQRFDVMKVVAQSWVVNTGIFLAYGLAQVGLGSSFKRGEISEALRFQLETIVGAWVAFWRAVSVAPSMRIVGRVMLYSFGALITVPFIAKNNGAKPYARETATIFDRNEGIDTSISEIERHLGRAYDSVSFSQDETLADLLASLRELIR